jgi:hypothetical protein
MDTAVVVLDGNTAEPTAEANALNTGRRFVKERMVKGEAALDALASLDPEKFARIAAKYGETPAQLKSNVHQDHDVVIDPDNEAVLFVCEGMNPDKSLLPDDLDDSLDLDDFEVASASLYSSAVADTAEPSTAEAFILHSRPGSSRLIYLDFDGHTTTGTTWSL